MNKVRTDVMLIAEKALESVLPETAVRKALQRLNISGRVVVVAVGKAAWKMAHAAREQIKKGFEKGIVITKYGHCFGEIEGMELFEASHPIPDENSVIATQRALDIVGNLTPDYTVLFLLSGGGSALFEKPAEGISLDDIACITAQLLNCGADITEINTIRKRLSCVKGGRFALASAPARVVSLVLSDVLGDRLDSIASGPACADTTTSEEAVQIVEKYGLKVEPFVMKSLRVETPKSLTNVTSEIIGSVATVCDNALKIARSMGYESKVLTTTLDCEAREAGRFIASIAREISSYERPLKRPCALIFGGETVVRITGCGKGGRSQELAFAASKGLQGLKNVALLSIGTDGTDGPTDAAGGLVDGTSYERMVELGIDLYSTLMMNDSYNALDKMGDLVKTGPTGTNVNDLGILLMGER
ncbi:MAG TPA: glycerate kinase [Kosmotogaceae bacterium]|nr:MAG: Hydroxypyruvate reductase [Thermotogales bacterium 46_20]HAA84880.1 glycerate kinase [Kosmotogaceae bacterium]